jgi:quercetin dioxygenase-like cupin family protein
MKTEELFIQGKNIQWEIVGDGVRRKIMGHDPYLMMVYVEFKKGSIGPRHAHPHTQVTYIESGSFEVFIGNEKQVLGAKDCYFIPANIEHGVIALEDSSLVDVFTPERQEFLKPVK